MAVSLIQGGVRTQEVKVPSSLDVPHKYPFPSAQRYRNGAIVVSSKLILPVEDSLGGEGCAIMSAAGASTQGSQQPSAARGDSVEKRRCHHSGYAYNRSGSLVTEFRKPHLLYCTSLVPRLPRSGTRTVGGEPGIFCHVKSAKGRKEVERT